MERLFEDLALKIEGEVKSYVAKRRYNKMLEELREGKVSNKTLKEALSFDNSKKPTEEQEINKLLIGFMVDNFVKANGQDALNELIDELTEEQKQSEDVVIKPEVIVASEPQQSEVVEEEVVETEQSEEIEVVPEQEIAEEVLEEVDPTNDKDTIEPAIEIAPEPIEEVIEPVVKEEVVVDEVEDLQPTPQPEPQLQPQQPKLKVQPEVVQQPEMIRPTSLTPKIDSVPVMDEPKLEVEESDYEFVIGEEGNNKKGGLLKYLAVGIPTLVLVGGLVFWQMNNQKQINTKAEAQATEILKGMPKETKKGDGLSNSEYEDNVEALTTIETIKQDDKTGLSGYLIDGDKKYIIKKYEQETGLLKVLDPDGEEKSFDNDWVESFIKKSKSKRKAEEKSEEQKNEQPSEQKEEGRSL